MKPQKLADLLKAGGIPNTGVAVSAVYIFATEKGFGIVASPVTNPEDILISPLEIKEDGDPDIGLQDLANVSAALVRQEASRVLKDDDVCSDARTIKLEDDGKGGLVDANLKGLGFTGKPGALH